MAETIGPRLKLLREFYGLSQRELAKRGGVPNSAISVIEQGSVSPSIQSLERVLKGFPLTLADFFAIDLDLDSISLSAEAGLADPSARGIHQALLSTQLQPASGPGLYLHSYCRTPADPGLNLLATGPTLILVQAGEVRFCSLGRDDLLAAGMSVSVTGRLPFRLQALPDYARWAVASCAPLRELGAA